MFGSGGNSGAFWSTANDGMEHRWTFTGNRWRTPCGYEWTVHPGQHQSDARCPECLKSVGK